MVTFRAWNRNWHGLALITLMTANTPQAMVASVTETFVGMAAVIHGKQGNNPAPTCLAVPIVAPVSAAGIVTGKGSATLQDTNAIWTVHQFSGTNGAFYVEFDCGLMADIVACDAATRTLTLPDNLPPQVAVGGSYRIRKHQTLSALLGANNNAGLQAGDNPGTADGVMLVIPQTQETRNFFYSDFPGYEGWYEDNYTPANAQVVYPEQGFIVRRKHTSDVVFCVSGAVKPSSTLAPIYPGNNLVGTMSFCKSVKLCDLNLFTSDSNSGLIAGDNPNIADNVTIYTSDNRLFTYFYADVAGHAGWYDGAYDPADNVSIPAGSAFFIHRKDPRESFTWSIPPE